MRQRLLPGERAAPEGATFSRRKSLKMNRLLLYPIRFYLSNEGRVEKFVLQRFSRVSGANCLQGLLFPASLPAQLLNFSPECIEEAGAPVFEIRVHDNG